MLALLYDVHGNLAALDAVLADAQAQGADRWLLGGDYALFGPEPEATVERLRGLAPATWIRGNGERWTADPDAAPDNPLVPAAIEACRAALGAALVEDLGALPEASVHGDTRYVHASPVSDVRSFLPEPDADEPELLAGVTEPRLVFGHTHLPFRRTDHRRDRARQPRLRRLPVRRRPAGRLRARARRRAGRAPPRRLRPRGERGPRARPLAGRRLGRRRGAPHRAGEDGRLMPTLAELEAVARGGAPAPLEPADRERIAAGRAVVEEAVATGRVVYGVTTGFGQLSSVRIDAADAAQLQVNLLRSHAVGSGPPLEAEVVRGMVLLLASSLRRGHSGVRVELVELLLGLLERGVVPVIPSRGSVGSSGDLAPLAHLALVLIGEGEAELAGERMPGSAALAGAGLEPVVLAAKEGLALINGTHLMAAAGGLALREAQRVLDAAVVAVALSLEAFKGSTVPFDARLHDLRGQPGQADVAGRLRRLLDGSPVVASHADCGRVQDPYTLRCAPQVLGAIADGLDYAGAALERELTAVTDNPLVFAADRRDPLGRQLPRAAAVAAAGPPRARHDGARELRRAARVRAADAELRRAAGVPDAAPGPLLGADDRPVRRGGARQRVPDAGAPGRRGVDPDLGRHGGLQLDGRVGGAEGADGGRPRRPRRGHGAGLRLPGPGVPPPAAVDRCARGGARPRAGARAAPRGGPQPRCRARGAGRTSAHRRPAPHLTPLGGIMWRVPAYTASKEQIQARLKRIEGQTRGVQKMVDEDRYCIDVLTQISAIQAALDKVALGLLDEHVKHCVVEGHGPGSQEELTEEMMGAIGRLLAR